MHVIQARNVNHALPRAVRYLSQEGQRWPSRNGDMIEAPVPVATVYLRPQERVLLLPERDANPFFHLYEAIWMLAGRSDLHSMEAIVKNMANYSDNGEQLSGAYGHRWRHHFLQDNLERVVEELQLRPFSRRAYLPMWNGDCDGRNPDALDLPCNVGVNFRLRSGELNMTVFNRSNDIIWGCYGANVVHMSMLQEYVAARLDVPIGTYTQVSDSFHAYVANEATQRTFEAVFAGKAGADPYTTASTITFPLDAGGNFDRDIHCLPESPLEPGEYQSAWFNQVFEPMMRSWRLYKQKQKREALILIDEVAATDWRIAARQWLERRI